MHGNVYDGIIYDATLVMMALSDDRCEIIGVKCEVIKQIMDVK